MMKKILTICLAAAFITSCASKEEKAEKNAKETFQERITLLESELINDSSLVLDKKKAREILSTYSEFAKKYPEDPASPGYLFKAGEVAMGLEKFDQSIGAFEGVTGKYPDYEKAPQALFLQAFIYDNSLQDDKKAKELYEQFIAKYPEHNLAPDARISLENIGKTDEELIREFDEKIKEQGKDPA